MHRRNSPAELGTDPVPRDGGEDGREIQVEEDYNWDLVIQDSYWVELELKASAGCRYRQAWMLNAKTMVRYIDGQKLRLDSSMMR